MRRNRGGPAVIHIDDPQGGADGYTFDITWNGSGQNGPVGGFGPDRDQNRDRDRDREFDRNRPPDRDRAAIRPYEPGEAVRACEDAAIDQAIDRFHTQAVAIRRSSVDDGPGRNDWVVGTLDARRGRDWDVYRFSCSVDFRERRLRSVDLNPAGPRR